MRYLAIMVWYLFLTVLCVLSILAFANLAQILFGVVKLMQGF